MRQSPARCKTGTTPACSAVLMTKSFLVTGTPKSSWYLVCINYLPWWYHRPYHYWWNSRDVCMVSSVHLCYFNDALLVVFWRAQRGSVSLSLAHTHTYTVTNCASWGKGACINYHHVLHQQLPLWGNRPIFLTNPSRWYLHDIPIISPILAESPKSLFPVFSCVAE